MPGVFHESVQALAHEEAGNTQRRFLAKIALNGVAQNRGALGRKRDVRILQLPQQSGSCFVREAASRVNQMDWAPAAGNLLDFFFERHARQKIGDAILDAEIGITVFRRGYRLPRLRARRCGNKQREEEGEAE